MPDERSGPSAAPPPHQHTYRHRELSLGDGTRLVLDSSGSIARIAPDGSTARSLMPGDPEWPGEAIRFGIRARSGTANPHNRATRPSREPRPL